MKIAATFLSTVLVVCSAIDAPAELVETEIPNVKAEMAELRTSDGVTHLGIRYVNEGSAEAGTSRFSPASLVLVDAKSKRKYLPIRDATGMFIAGPIGDAIDGGRIYVKLRAGQQGVAWAYFEPLPPGTVVSVEAPQMFPFEGVTVTSGPSKMVTSTNSKSIPNGGSATLSSAVRADQTAKLRLKLAAEPGMKVVLRSPYFEYRNVYLFDSKGKRRYPLLTDSEGIAQASPIGQRMDGGTFIPNWSAPILMSLSFQAPPDDVTSVDLVLPDFLPMESVAIQGSGGAGAGGIAAAGKSLGLEGALQDLSAEVTPQEIRIALSSDVLFDFDKAELKPAAEVRLNNLLTIVRSRPDSKVLIEGHTDTRGEEAYNMALSRRRAEAVRTWLVNHDVISSRITATGAGESRPVRSGSTEADHQANRRVEIRIRN